MKKINKAFTLAEALITLLVIGVATTLILPVFLNNTNEKVQESQRKVFESKLKEGLHRMQIKGDLARDYESTAEFVENMKNYFNITKICPANSLTGCFGTKIRSGSVNIITKDINNSDELGANFANTSDVIGIMQNDGTSALITYNTDCYIANTYDQTTDVTQCLAMYYDINATRYPNTVGEDIGELNLGSVAAADDLIELGEIFVPARGFSQEECEQARDKFGAPINDCPTTIYGDYYAAAVYKCHREGKRLPTPSELYKFAPILYDAPLNKDRETNNLSIANQELKEKLWSGNGMANGSANFITNKQTTDGKFIYVAFGEKRFNPVVEVTRNEALSRGKVYVCVEP